MFHPRRLRTPMRIQPTKNHDSDDDGSQQLSPSQYRQHQANENADASQDDDGSDKQSDSGSKGTSECVFRTMRLMHYLIQLQLLLPLWYHMN